MTGYGPMPAEDADYDDRKVASAIDDVAFLPLYSARRFKLTSGNAIDDYAAIEDYLPFKRSWLKRQVATGADHLALLHVAGNAMEPLLRDQDIVFIDLAQDQIREGIYAVIIAEHLVVKRLQPSRSALRVTSEHKSYDPIEIPGTEIGDRLKLVGRVFGSIHDIF